MDNKPIEKYNKSDVILVAFFAGVCIFCVAVMAFFLIKYPLQWSSANGKGGLVVLLAGFAYLIKLFWPHLRKPIITPQQTTSSTPPVASKPGWKGIPRWKQVLIIIGVSIYVAGIIFAFGAILIGFFALP